MDGFHALGTQGRSHPQKRQDPAEVKLPNKSCSAAGLKATTSVWRRAIWSIDRSPEPKVASLRSATKSKAKPHTSQPLTLAPTSLPPSSFAAKASSPSSNFARAARTQIEPRLNFSWQPRSEHAGWWGSAARRSRSVWRIRPHLAWPWESFSCSDCRLFLPPVQLLSQGCLPLCTTPAAPLPAR